MKNYLPFARRANIVVPGAANGKPGEAYTRISDLGTGGAIKAHLQDVIIEQEFPYIWDGDWPDIPAWNPFTQGGRLKVRLGIHGKDPGFFTDELYDWRCYCDGQCPAVSVWNWRRPYRLYPGQQMHVMMRAAAIQLTAFNGVMSAMFNGQRVDNAEPYLLYQSVDFRYDTANDPGGISLADCVMACPSDTPLDLYSFSVGPWAPNSPLQIYILDGNERPFWPGKEWPRIPFPISTPIILGTENENWKLVPGEVFTCDFECWDDASTLNDGQLHVSVTLRGVLEVDDGR